MLQQLPKQRKVKEKIEGELEKEGEGFEAFWADYERKQGRQAALKAWQRLSESDRAAAKARAKSFCAEITDKQFVPHASTYLNGRRWEDAPPPKPMVNGVPAPMTRAEAMEELRRIRERHGIEVGGFIDAKLIPAEVTKAMRTTN